MSGTFRNDISTTGFVDSKKLGKIVGSMVELPTASAEYDGRTIQYLGETIDGTIWRKYNTYLCEKQADGTFAWIDNSPAGGGKWGKIIGDVEDQTDMIGRIQAILNNASEDSTHTWTASQLKAKFAALAGVASVVVVETRPTTPELNTIYYVGTASPYHVWLYAKKASGEADWFDFGTTEISFENYYTKDIVDDMIGAETTARAAAVAQEALDRTTADNEIKTAKQNKITYGSALPDPTTLAVGDLFIKNADDGVWSRVNPDEIISDGTKSGDKTWSSNKIDLTFYDKTTTDGKVNAKQNKVLTGTVPPTPDIGVAGDLYINYGADQHWISVDLNQIINDSVTAGDKTWSSNELNARFRALASSVKVEIVATKPATGILNTTYYVGTGSPYHVWLYSNNSVGVATWFDLGTTSIDFSNYYNKEESNSTFIKNNGCTIPVGGIYTTLDTIDPATKWHGTTWTALPDYKEWDEISETLITNPAGVEGVIAYSVHCNVVTIKFDAVKCAEPVHNYFMSIPTKYNPNANQLCVVLNAWDDLTTKTFACVTTTFPENGNIYLRRISNTENTQYGFISYPCGGGTPDRTYKRYKRLT